VVINATWGVGEALVSGQITPDMIIAEKTSGRIIRREVGNVAVPTSTSMSGPWSGHRQAPAMGAD
jgi:pyruvate,water dikinase